MIGLGFFKFSMPVAPVNGSMVFPGSFGTTYQYLTIPNDSTLRLRTNDFTIEWFTYWDSANERNYPRFFSMGISPSATLGVSLEIDTNFYFYFNGTTYTVASLAASTYKNKWVHWAITRTSGIIRVFLNGLQIGSNIADSSDHNDATNDLCIGNELSVSPSPYQTEFAGYMTNFHIVNGTSLYSAAFVPPTSTVSAVSNTKLLITANTSLPIIDSSSYHKTISNTLVTWGSSTPFVYLPATRAYLSSTTDLLTNTKTVEDGIDRWFRDLNGYANGSYTTFNVWSKISAIYPIIGGTSASVSKNAKNPSLYTLSHTGSPTILAAVGSNISYNGTSQFSDTNFIGPNSGSWSTGELSTFGIHRRDSNIDSNASLGVATGGNTYGIFRNDAFTGTFLGSNGNQGNWSATSSGLWSASMGSSSTKNTYYNGNNVNASTGLTFGSTGSSSIYIGAFHGGAGAGYGGPTTVDYFWLGQGIWSDAEQLAMYNAFSALQTILGR